MSSILSIATSGALAAQTRPQVSASHVANANSGSPPPPAPTPVQSQSPPAYTPQQVNQAATPGGGAKAAGGNPQPSITNRTAQLPAPNVQFTNELLQQQIDRIQFVSNFEVAQVYSQMMQNLLNVGV